MLSNRSTLNTGLLTILLYARSQIAPSSLIGSPIAPLSNARKIRLLRLLRRASGVSAQRAIAEPVRRQHCAMPTVSSVERLSATRVQRPAPLQSTGQRWRLANEACIVDLLDKKVRDVGARDEPRAPVARIDSTRYAPVPCPSLRMVSRTIVQSSRLRRMIHSCASLSS